MKSLTRDLALSVGAGIVAAVITGCHRDEAKGAAMTQLPSAAVTVAAAVTRDVPVYIDQIGRTVAVETVWIMPQVDGKVIAVHVENGAYVKKGDLLFEIDARPFQALLDAAQATLAQNKAERDLAQIEYDRAKELIAGKAVSQIEFEQKRSAYEVAEAKVLAAEAAIAQAKLNLEYTKINSPISGRTGARLVDPGNIVKANETAMMVIQQLDPIYAEFTVTENDLGTVRKFLASRGLDMGIDQRNLSVWVDVPGDSQQILSAVGSIPAATQPTTQRGVGAREGRLTFLDNSVQGNSGTVRLRATVPNSDRYFWPGQFVNCRVVLTTKKGAVLIPAQAQQIGQQGSFVFVVKPDMTAEQRPITPGQRHGEMLVVEQGVDPGESIVVTGQMMLQPGGSVMVTNQSTTQPQSSARAE